MRALRAGGWLAVGVVAGWYLTPTATEVQYETIVREVRTSWDDALQWETPVIDSMFTDEEWAEMDRQSDCLFEFLQGDFGHEITMNRVLAAGYWTDELGGACAVIGED